MIAAWPTAVLLCLPDAAGRHAGGRDDMVVVADQLGIAFDAKFPEGRMRCLLLCLAMSLLATPGPHGLAYAQYYPYPPGYYAPGYYPPGYYPPGYYHAPPPPPAYMYRGGPPPNYGAPYYYGPGNNPNNCGTPDEPKPCYR